MVGKSSTNPLGASSVRAGIEHPEEFGPRQISGWVLGPLVLLGAIVLPPPGDMAPETWRTIGLAALMAIFWVCEPVPIPATSLLPVVLLPALGLSDVREATAPYANPIVFLFLGGFLIAAAMQKTGLHRRLALGILGRVGTRPGRVVAGCMLAAAFVSMWVNNTATTMMMLPIVLSVVALLPDDLARQPEGRAFASALLLGTAYAATCGGMATLIGTAPNALVAAFVSDRYGIDLGFGRWMVVGLPVTLVALPVVWVTLTKFVLHLGREPLPGLAGLIARERGSLGPFSFEQAAVTVVFALTAIAWILQPWISRVLPMATDTTIAIAGALLLFAIPVPGKPVRFLMNWDAARSLPLDVLVLFGGGLSLAAAMQKHGVAEMLGRLAGRLDALPVLLVVAVVCFGVLLLTELTSNTATAATFLPVVGAMAVSLGENPLLFLIPTALAANCSFMLPVGTPPNAIVFGSGHIRLPDMARAGLCLNVLLLPVLVALVVLLGRLAFGIELGAQPSWAAPGGGQ